MKFLRRVHFEDAHWELWRYGSWVRIYRIYSDDSYDHFASVRGIGNALNYIYGLIPEGE